MILTFITKDVTVYDICGRAVMPQYTQETGYKLILGNQGDDDKHCLKEDSDMNIFHQMPEHKDSDKPVHMFCSGTRIYTL